MSEPIPVIVSGVSHLQTDFTDSMRELKQLALADQLKPVQEFTQMLELVNHKTYFGQGKVQELKQLAQYHQVDLILVNDELTPAQLRNLEKDTKLHFLDRTELILQVFSQRAHSRQAQLQVAIAQLQYQLPRVHPSGNPLDQQRGGGLANRGTGESQLELDRRVIKQRITKLKHELKQLQKALTTQSKRRRQSQLPQVALVGYTNAGKSTTLNGVLDYTKQTTAKQVGVKDQLFATLDTSVRTIKPPAKARFLLSDTVGFINKLPHKLIAAFRSTLAEAQNADLLVQVVDYADANHEQMIDVTQQTLAEIGIHDKPMIFAYNKADQVTHEPAQIKGNTIYYSAKRLQDIALLIQLIEQTLSRDYVQIAVVIPYACGDIVNQIQANLTIQEQYFTAKGTYYRLQVARSQAAQLQPYEIALTDKPMAISSFHQ
ncbi:GTPase HflX [Bombilactobacillus folatiphilus]|uniref:GTPase HflX n=1 Tax=Bombilactobacillus folatiphilus TaxID=2923362 RepID=A0ABY4P9E6_9LACO|nr:GTPase HflX [Bombilactobacillus folatiphilus]UQS82245.1 GTPase HflX [Bombilactobacillus folatiphilus]